MKMSWLLDKLGISLDGKNKGAGGKGDTWPVYRQTGIGLIVEYEYWNTETSNPFDFSKRGKVTILGPSDGGDWETVKYNPVYDPGPQDTGVKSFTKRCTSIGVLGLRC